MSALEIMELDILHRFETLGAPTRDEKEIILMLRLHRSLLNYNISVDESSYPMENNNVDEFLKSIDLSSLNKNNRACSICMKPFGSTDPPEDPCKVLCAPGHIFGSNCIRKWIATKRTCPMCREELVPQDVEPVGYMPVGTPWWLKVMRSD
jgi:hypothetical protein